MDHDHPLEFGYSLVAEARPPASRRDGAPVGRRRPDDARVRDEKTVEGYLG
jgi:hypothetical protein